MSEALDIARDLIEHGIPVFTAKAALDRSGVWDPAAGTGNTGYVLPSGWQATIPDLTVIDRYQQGDALCAVMGHHVDGLDVDPRNEGDASREQLVTAGLWPQTYGTACTPSGGTHELIAPLHVGSKDGLRPGLDVKGGKLDGTSRGFLFIAPTVRLSKATGELASYSWQVEPLLDEITERDDSGLPIADMIASREYVSTAPEPPTATLSASDRPLIDKWVSAAVEGIQADLRATSGWANGQRDDRGRGWEKLQADAAYRLGRIARANWNTLTLEQAHAAFITAAPTSSTWTTHDVEQKWRTQSQRGEPAGMPQPAPVSECPSVASVVSLPSQDDTTKKSAAAVLVDLALERYDFGCSPDGDAFAIRRPDGHVVRMLKGGQVSLRTELASAYRAKTGRVAAQQALADAMLVLAGMADESEPTEIALRIAEDTHGGVWIDLGDRAEHVICITAAGWDVREATGRVKFRRTKLTAALPEPVRGGDLAELWNLVNVAEADRQLVLAWLVAALVRPDIPHPVLALFGEQGTGKSSASKLLTALIDPSPVQLRKPPKDAEGWVTAAAGSWVVGLDNLSTLPAWFSDSLCRAVTGDGDVRRALYTDGDVAVFAFRRVILLNGIDVGAMAGDLADRAIVVNLDQISESQRRTESQLAKIWREAHPRILGALLTECAECLGVLPSVRLERTPRMADFAEILAALDQRHGTTGLQSYSDQARTMAEDTLAAEPFLDRMRHTITDEFVGTAAHLHERVTPDSPPRNWPTARGVTSLLRRNAPGLRKSAWIIEDAGRDPNERAVLWRICPPEINGKRHSRHSDTRKTERSSEPSDVSPTSHRDVDSPQPHTGQQSLRDEYEAKGAALTAKYTEGATNEQHV